MIDVVICVDDEGSLRAAKGIIKDASIYNYTILDKRNNADGTKIKEVQKATNSAMLPLVSLRTGDEKGIVEKLFRTGHGYNALASLMLEIQSYVKQLIKNNESTSKAVE